MKLTFSIPLATKDFYPDMIRCIATDGDAITIQPQSHATTIWLDEIETKYWNRELARFEQWLTRRTSELAPHFDA